MMRSPEVGPLLGAEQRKATECGPPVPSTHRWIHPSDPNEYIYMSVCAQSVHTHVSTAEQKGEIEERRI